MTDFDPKNLGIGNTAGPGGGLYAGNIREGTCYYFFFPSMLFEFFLVVFLFPALWRPRYYNFSSIKSLSYFGPNPLNDTNDSE